MTDNAKLDKLKATFNWCLNNTFECEDTKYEEDSVVDNWNKILTTLKEVFPEV